MGFKKLLKVICYLSVFLFLYFIVLVGLTYFPVEITLFNVVAELLTIPAILSLVFCFAFCSYQLFKKNYIKLILIPFLLNLTTIILLVVETV